MNPYVSNAVALFITAPSRWFWGLSPMEFVELFKLRWLKYMRNLRSNETYILEIQRLNELEENWRRQTPARKLWRWLRRP